MNTKWWLIIFSVLILIALVSYVSFFHVVRSPPSTCQVLAQGTADSTGIVFFGSMEEAQRYKDALTGFVPFNETNAFTWYVSDFKPSCEFYQGVALLCYSKEVVQHIHACGADYGVVLRDADLAIRSSAFDGIMSINTRHRLSVFAHEFGHAFGGFDEEYTPASLSGGAGNCEATCQAFGSLDGCYQGCSKSDYYRSIESGIMRTLSASRYGTWHEAYLRTKLTDNEGILTGKVTAPVDCATQTYTLLTLTRDSAGILHLVTAEPIQGCGDTLNDIESSRFILFSDVQPEGSVMLEGEQYAYEGTVYATVASDITTLQLTSNGQLTGEVHLGATLCKQ